MSQMCFTGGVGVPGAQIIPRELYSLPRFISGVYLRMYNMRLGKGDREKVVHMCRETLEACFISHKSVYENEQQCSAPIPSRLRRDQRVR